MTELQRISSFNTTCGFPQVVREPHHPHIDAQVEFIKEEMRETLEAHARADLIEMLDGSADLIVTAAGLIHRLGFDPDTILAAINDSNESKFCVDEDEAIMSVEAYQNNLAGKRYSDIHYEQVGDKWVIFGYDSKGSKKILKGYAYKSPTVILQEIVDGQGKTQEDTTAPTTVATAEKLTTFINGGQ